MSKKKTLGRIIREKRQVLDCSQEAVAAALGVSIKFISLVENGERQLSCDHFPRLSEFLEIPLKVLFQAKFSEDNSQNEIRRIRKELSESSGEVQRAIDFNRIRDVRIAEIEEKIKFLEMKRQNFISKIRIAYVERQQVENQIQTLTDEKTLLGFGQLEMSFSRGKNER